MQEQAPDAAPVTEEVGSKRKDPPAEKTEEEPKKAKSDTVEVLKENPKP